MADPNGTAPIEDLRTKVGGAISQKAGMFAMLGLAGVVLLIVATTGYSTPPQPVRAVPPASAGMIPSPERIRKFGEQVSAMTMDGQPVAPIVVPERPRESPETGSAAPKPVDQLAEDRKRREYESLFASNVVLSRRPAGERPEGTTSAATQRRSADPDEPQRPMAPPRLEEVADAVAKAMGGSRSPEAPPSPERQPVGRGADRNGTFRPRVAAPLHRVDPGVDIETTLENEIVGMGPVRLLVSTHVYAHDYVKVIPQGSKIIGQATRASETGEDRMSVVFDTLLLPNGDEVNIDDLIGLNQGGDQGLKGKVDRRLIGSFAAAGAIGVISGIGQAVAGLGGRDRGGVTVITADVGNSTSQATNQAMRRSLNPTPTVTIPRGHRVRVNLRTHLDLPAWSGQ